MNYTIRLSLVVVIGCTKVISGSRDGADTHDSATASTDRGDILSDSRDEGEGFREAAITDATDAMTVDDVPIFADAPFDSMDAPPMPRVEYCHSELGGSFNPPPDAGYRRCNATWFCSSHFPAIGSWICRPCSGADAESWFILHPPPDGEAPYVLCPRP